jgi:tetratricopeptide (TPR) repeat protein
VAHADPRADFEKARAAFTARNWTEAEDKFRTLLDARSGLKERSLISQSRMYLGAALLQQGKKDEAKEVFEKLAVEDPTFELDPLSYPGPAIDMYIDVRSSMLEQIRIDQQNKAQLAKEKKAAEEAERAAQREWLEKVKKQAAEEKITVKHSRLIAALPFGIGQFQNRDPVLGWIFLGAEVAAITGTAITFGMYNYARGRADEEKNGSNQLTPQWLNRAEDIRVVNLGFTIGLIGAAAVGITQAQIAFTPEAAVTKPRDLPPLEKRPPKTSSGVSDFVPLVSPVAEGGVMFGGAARF